MYCTKNIETIDFINPETTANISDQQSMAMHVRYQLLTYLVFLYFLLITESQFSESSELWVNSKSILCSIFRFSWNSSAEHFHSDINIIHIKLNILEYWTCVCYAGSLGEAVCNEMWSTGVCWVIMNSWPLQIQLLKLPIVLMSPKFNNTQI